MFKFVGGIIFMLILISAIVTIAGIAVTPDSDFAPKIAQPSR